MQGDGARLASENFSGVLGRFSPQASPSQLFSTQQSTWMSSVSS